ncbi:MAG: 2-oxoacid:acceptor oxidoreductase family protein, partial [Candidatus Sumerlaeia bacterium]|nr:2-oxoacid:acceptor oxidoreductase family protein [Candidatus Sumerlaeia bacterium]
MKSLIININIGGEAGQGVQTLGNIIARTLFRYGYFVHTEQSYHSRIRGGHNAYRIRACADQPVLAPDDVFDLVLALNAESVQLYRPHLREKGIIISDEVLDGDVKLPIQHLLKELKAPVVSATTILFAGLCKALGLPEAVCTRTLAEEVGEKHKDLNLALFRETQKLNIPLFRSLPHSKLENKILLTASDAVGFGALVAGCRFISAYPMTPGSSVFAYLAGKEKDYGVVAEQAEDEIAALNMAIGANFAGVRSM